MSDPASKDMPFSTGQSMMLRAWQSTSTKPGEKVVSFLPSSEGGSGAMSVNPDNAGGPPLREWSAAVDLIEEASEAIRIGEQRAAELEAQLTHVTTQASEEMRRLNQQISLTEQKLSRAEERARLAESRAHEAEAWLVRLHDAAITAFGSRAAQKAASFDSEPSD